MPGFEGTMLSLLWEAKFPSESEGTMYFPKQHYESIVPEKSGINRFSASHDIDLFFSRDLYLHTDLWFSPIAINATSVYCRHIVIDVTTCRETLLSQAKSDSAWRLRQHYHFIVPARLTIGFSRIYHDCDALV